MYIRNSRGQLVWVPSQESVQAAQAALHTMQENARNQMQRDEWTRFNAPPVNDNLVFDDQYSVFEGSLSHGYHNVVHPIQSPAMSSHGNLVYHGQQPYNPIDPPIPRVINPTPGLQGSHQSITPIPQVIHSIPESPGPHQTRAGMMSPSARMMHSTPTLLGTRQNTGANMMATVPQVIHSTPPPPGTRQNTRANMKTSVPRVIYPTPSPPGTRQNTGGSIMTTMPRAVHCTPALHDLRQNNGVDMMNPMHRVVHSVPAMHKPRQSNGADVINPIPQVIHSTPAVNDPRQNIGNVMSQNLNAPEVPNIVYHPSHNSFDVIEEEEDVYDPSRNTIDPVEEDFFPELNTSCLGTIFGSSIGLYDFKPPSRKPHVIDCNALNISTSDDNELKSDLSSSINHSQKFDNFQKCIGVRGPGKKFDYAGEQKSFSTNVGTNSEEKSYRNPEDDPQLDDSRTPEIKSENQENTNSSESRKEETELIPSTFSDEEDIESCSSMNAVAEESFEDYSSAVEQVHPIPDNDQQNVESRDDADSKLPSHLVKDENKCEDPRRSHSQVDPPIDENRKKQVNEDGSIEQFDTTVVKEGSIEEDYPSFDEPAVTPKSGDNINKDKFPSAESASDGENTPKNANALPSVERVSVSKRYMRKRRNARRQNLASDENKGAISLRK